MRIDQDHLYYGAAIIQVAEHPSFTAINDFKTNGRPVRCAYWVNQDIGLYLKYRSTPDRTARWGKVKAKEYSFSFNRDARKTIRQMAKHSDKVYVGLVCVEDRQICCLSVEEFNRLVSLRRSEVGKNEDQYVVWVALPKNSKFRAYVTPAARKNMYLGEPLRIAQSAFPAKVFE